MFICMISCLLMSGCGKKPGEYSSTESENPFFRAWATPYGVPPFDEIKPEHYIPAFEEGIKQQKTEIEAIVSNPDDPTFDNTLVPLEYSGQLLTTVSMVFFNLEECMKTDEMSRIADSVHPLVSKHEDDIMLNKALFQRIKTVYNQRDTLSLSPENARLLELTYKRFVRGGANIPETRQARFREINEQLVLLTHRFGDHVLKATNDYKLVISDKARLSGLSEDMLAAAAETANKEEETKGKWVFTIHLPSMEPFLQNCADREARKELWTAYSQRCTSGETDNRPLVDSIVNLRLERATLLGYPSHAAYILDNNMAKTPEDARTLLQKMWYPALAKAKADAEEYNRMIKAEGHHFSLEPWDWRYYEEKVRREKYALDEESIRPYFSLETVREGIFTCAGNLYGISFQRAPQLPVYEQGVEAYEVKEGEKVIAILYLDYFPRPSKRSGAWMTEFRTQHRDKNGNNVLPVISLVMNFTAPVGDKPSLLNFDQTETFFHEFGHALHGMLSQCQYASIAGTNVSRDFVEMPSQFFEHWARHPQVMKLYAKHYQTGQPIPDSLILKIEKSATFGQGFINTELLAASFLDLDYHTVTKPTHITLPDFENAVMQKIGLIKEIIPRYRSTYYQHIFSDVIGYSAGYYSYTWAAVLDNDAFEPFKEKGIFNPEMAKLFRSQILERGNSEEPMKLYINYRGQEPSIEPILKNRGLK